MQGIHRFRGCSNTGSDTFNIEQYKRQMRSDKLRLNESEGGWDESGQRETKPGTTGSVE